MDDVTPEEFFSNNSLKDLEKGTYILMLEFDKKKFSRIVIVQ